jgi:hypothetical protein
MGLLEIGLGPIPVGCAGGTTETCGFTDGAVGVRDSHPAIQSTAVRTAAPYLIMSISSAATMGKFGVRVFANSSPFSGFSLGGA